MLTNIPSIVLEIAKYVVLKIPVDKFKIFWRFIWWTRYIPTDRNISATQNRKQYKPKIRDSNAKCRPTRMVDRVMQKDSLPAT